MIMIRHELKLIQQLQWKIDTSKNSQQSRVKTRGTVSELKQSDFIQIQSASDRTHFFQVHNQHFHTAENEQYNVLLKPVGELMNGPSAVH